MFASAVCRHVIEYFVCEQFLANAIAYAIKANVGSLLLQRRKVSRVRRIGDTETTCGGKRGLPLQLGQQEPGGVLFV